MKNIIILTMVLLPALTNAQVLERTETIKYDAAQKMTEKTVRTIEANETVPLNGVTFGIGMGYSYLFENPKDYFLTSDAAYKLQIQELSKSGIVLSSVISIKLGKMSVQKQKDGVSTKKCLLVLIG